MKRCIIHVGMHKTASTSIQSSLQGFADDRFLYADLGDSNHSAAMYSLFASHPGRHHQHRLAGRDATQVAAFASRVRDKLEAAIAAAGERTLLLSGEGISMQQEPDLERMREFFDARFDELRIVAYVRAPAGYITSVFQQRVKGGSPRRGFDLWGNYRQYRQTFGTFDAVFGRQRVQLWKFDPPAFPQGCAVRDFCTRLGIALPPKRIVRLNEALPREMVSLLYSYARLGPERGYDRLMPGEGEELAERLGGTAGQKFRLSPDVVRPILEEHAVDIRWMEDRLGAPLAENLGEHRPGDVRSEEDLLQPDARMADRLRQVVAKARRKADPSMDAVDLVHVLYPRKRAPAAKPKGPRKIKISELIAEARQSDPRLLKAIPNDKAAELLRSVFRQINETIGNAGSGAVGFTGLGLFSIREVEKDAGGKKASVKRIVFRRAGEK